MTGRSFIEAVAQRVGGDPEAMLAAPYIPVGTVDEIVNQVQNARARWGFTYFVTRSMEPTTQIIAALR